MTQQIALTLPGATTPSAAADLAVCRGALAHHSKSFHLASRLLGATAQNEAAAVYAYCRRVDDAIDDVPPAQAIPALRRLRTELANVYSGAPQSDPVLRAFQHVAFERQIHSEYPRELLAGMEMDVNGAVYNNMDDLLLYCHRVAGVVGLMMCHVLGVREQRALVHAAHLGMAMQLTNICRDVAEDWTRDRLYLPDSVLAAHGAPGLQTRIGTAFPAELKGSFAGALDQLLGTADHYYRSGHAGLWHLPFRAAVSIRTAAQVYAEIGEELRRRDLNVLAGRAVVSKRRKLALALRAVSREALSIPKRSVTPFQRATLSKVVRFPDDILCG